MRKKLIFWLGSGVMVGTLVSLTSILFSYPDNCSEYAMTCFRNKGFPIAVYRGLGYEGLPWDFNLLGLVINTFIWILFSIMVFAIIFYILDRKRSTK